MAAIRVCLAGVCTDGLFLQNDEIHLCDGKRTNNRSTIRTGLHKVIIAILFSVSRSYFLMQILEYDKKYRYNEQKSKSSE